MGVVTTMFEGRGESEGSQVRHIHFKWGRDQLIAEIATLRFRSSSLNSFNVAAMQSPRGTLLGSV